MCVCTRVYVSVHMCMCVHVCMHVYVRACDCVHMCVCMHTCMHMCVCVRMCVCVCVVLSQSCLTLSDGLDCSPPGPFVQQTSQVRILKWVSIFYSRVSSGPKD